MSLLLVAFITSGFLIAMLAYVFHDTEATQAEVKAALDRRHAWTSQGIPRPTGMAVDTRPRRPGFRPRSKR